MKSDSRSIASVFKVIIVVIVAGYVSDFNSETQFIVSPRVPSVFVAYAEDDEYEDEEEDEEDERDEDEDSKSASSTASRTTTVTTYETREVEKVISTLDPKFTEDHDGDTLVDGIDPHPTVHEKEYFTDNDGDSVANANDKYPDLDDFFVYAESDDSNKNGILDFYE